MHDVSVSRTPGSSRFPDERGRAEPAEHCAGKTRPIHCLIVPTVVMVSGQAAALGWEKLLAKRVISALVTVVHWRKTCFGISRPVAMTMQLPVSNSDRGTFTRTPVPFAPILGSRQALTCVQRSSSQVDDPTDDPTRGGNAAWAVQLAPVRPSQICSKKGQTMHLRRFMATPAAVAATAVAGAAVASADVVIPATPAVQTSVVGDTFSATVTNTNTINSHCGLTVLTADLAPTILPHRFRSRHLELGHPPRSRVAR